MPRGIHLPVGRIAPNASFNGPSYDYRFRISDLNNFTIDPREYPPIMGISDEKYENGIDARAALEAMDIDDILELYIYRNSILRNSRGRHRDFENLIHLIFPAMEERPLRYIAIWLIRDRVSFWEVARRIGRAKGKVLKTDTIKKYWEYIERRIANFCRAVKLKDKFVDDHPEMVEDFLSKRHGEVHPKDRSLVQKLTAAVQRMRQDGLSEDEVLHMEVRELVNG